MLTYIFKRLVLMTITLLGIVILTFAISRLTPGDPAMLATAAEGARASDGLTDEFIRETRRAMGLDRPLLLNLNFENREWLARDCLDRYLKASGFWRENARFELIEINTIALAPALDRLEKETDERRKRDLAALLPLLARRPELEQANAAELADPRKALEFWKRFLHDNSDVFDTASIRGAAARYLADGNGADRERLVAAGGLALADLMPALLGSDGVRRSRALAAAQRCANKPANWAGVLQESEGASENSAAPTQTSKDAADDSARQLAETVMRWRSWWRRVELRFTLPPTWKKCFHVVTNTQFGIWMGQFLTFDFGVSTRENRPVIEVLKERLPVTIQLNVLSILLMYILAIPLGIFSATHQDTKMDRFLTLILFLLYSIPSFWLAQVMILMTTGGPGWPDWFPSRGLSSEGAALGAAGWPFHRWLLDRLWHLVLPVVTESIVALAFLSRQMRVSMLETIRQDFIRTARAKGLSEFVVVYKHAVRNSLIPIITLAADLLPGLIAGSVIVESIFSLNGMGKLAFEAILNRNYPVINCVFAFSALLTLAGILIADLGYALADPRIRYE